ncbi:RuvC-like resolvase [Gordonia phage Marietta]|uniref:RuvC-like resolvase n=1 Tax=Gordonia phage Marietta TaxID=2301558 RepID=A0A385DRE4_9CAUD|nr:RuvC-like resolvase [Gordonia phage Marietta]AXQ61378.1 RuvC-like resolvase [Gordonia phage Marietta]QAU06384.1 RuvC-like resolvase [Gordonia phage WhoseManz]
MIPEPTPKDWLDRQDMAAEIPRPVEELVAGLSEVDIRILLGRGLRVIAFDPGGTTGWSVMRLDPAKLLDKTASWRDVITHWWHGEIDCGAMSGSVNDAAITQLGDEIDLGGSLSGEHAGAYMMDQLVNQAGGRFLTALVIEDFILRTQTQKRDALSPVRLTAAFEQMIWERPGYPTPKRQQPSEAKSSITDERLKQWGFWASGSRHARDADRHAILFLRKVRQARSDVYRAWPILKAAVELDLIQL